MLLNIYATQQQPRTIIILYIVLVKTIAFYNPNQHIIKTASAVSALKPKMQRCIHGVHLPKRGSNQTRATRQACARVAVVAPASDVVGEWVVTAEAGPRYTALSGDWNPIHLWPWSARLMGMHTPITHGMETMARVCTAFEQSDNRRVTSLACRFKRAVPLGASVTLMACEVPTSFVVLCGDRVAVEDVLGYA